LLPRGRRPTKGAVVLMHRGQGIVSRHPNVLNGDLIFAGTQVPAKNLADCLTAGETLEYFLEGFLAISREQAVAYLEISHKAVEKAVMSASTPR
jgi:uncharacterized protein (DUF433 family)